MVLVFYRLHSSFSILTMSKGFSVIRCIFIFASILPRYVPSFSGDTSSLPVHFMKIGMLKSCSSSSIFVQCCSAWLALHGRTTMMYRPILSE